MHGIVPVATRPRRLRRRVCDCNDDAAGVRRVSRHTDRHHRDQRPDHRAVARLRAVARGRGRSSSSSACSSRSSTRVRSSASSPTWSSSSTSCPNPFERFLIGLSQFVAVLYPIVLVAVVPRVAPSDRTARRGRRGHGRGVRGLGHRAGARDEPSGRARRGAEGAHLDRRFRVSRLRVRRCRVRARGRRRCIGRAPVAARRVGVRRIRGRRSGSWRVRTSRLIS